MACSWDRVSLGGTGLRVSPLGLGSSYGIGAEDVEHAFDRGINCFYWGTLRRPSFGAGIGALARSHRDEMVVVVQTYSRVAMLMRPSLEVALRRLRLDHADVLLLGMWNSVPPERFFEAALRLIDAGLARHLMISCHRRATFGAYVDDPRVEAIMVRYNAAHPGAEDDVFPELVRRRPGVVAYTATCWGRLLDPRLTPAGERTPRASDCYRFALTRTEVDVALAGPANSAQLDEAMAALDRGPMSAEELAWMKRVGVAARGPAVTFPPWKSGRG